MGMGRRLPWPARPIGSNDCIASTGATGFGLANLAISFGPAATARTSGYAVDIETCTTCTLENLTLNNGDLSGLRLASSVHTYIHNLQISNFFANGTFLINNQDLRVNGLSCMNNGDACFETSWFDSEFTAHAIPCEDITASNIRSYNDVEAILINACSNVRWRLLVLPARRKRACSLARTPPPPPPTGLIELLSLMARFTDPGTGPTPSTPPPRRLSISM